MIGDERGVLVSAMGPQIGSLSQPFLCVVAEATPPAFGSIHSPRVIVADTPSRNSCPSALVLKVWSAMCLAPPHQ